MGMSIICERSTPSAGWGASPGRSRLGVLNSGIMYECVKAGVDVVLAGSIRDDGPLPEVISDTLVAQDRMRQAIRRCRVCALDCDGASLDRDGQPLAGVGEGGLCRYQSGDGDEALRPRDIPDDRSCDRRRAVLAVARDRTFVAAGRRRRQRDRRRLLDRR